MTKKHFIALAQALYEAKPGTFATNYLDRHTAWKCTVGAVAAVCAASNPAFNRAKFLAACGMEV